MITSQDCILGSGSASASLALRLARSGRSVVVVEEGRAVADGFGWTEAEVSRDLLRQGGRLPTHDGSMSVVQGRCVGGSATVGAGIADGPDPAALREWGERGWSPDLLDRFGAAAAEVLASAATHDADERGAAADGFLARGALARKEPGRWLGRMRSRPIIDGLEEARTSYGAEIRSETRVGKVLMEKGRAVRAIGAGSEIVAERYILCAGAIQSSLLLQRSGLGGPAVGRDLTLTHRVLVLGRMRDPLPDGPPPGAFVLDGRLRGTDESSGFAISAAHVGPVLFAGHSRMELSDLSAVLRDWTRFLPVWVSVPEFGARASADRRGDTLVRRASLASTVDALHRGAAAAAELLFAAGASEVVLPVHGTPRLTAKADVASFRERTLKAADFPMICLDPQGGCELGPGGVVDEMFRVHGTDNLYVADASLFPTSVGLNPMVPVMALGELLATTLLK